MSLVGCHTRILLGTRLPDLILLVLPGYIPGYPQSKYLCVVSVVGYYIRILRSTFVPDLIFLVLPR